MFNYNWHAGQISSLIRHGNIEPGECGCVHAYRGEQSREKEADRHGSYKRLATNTDECNENESRRSRNIPLVGSWRKAEGSPEGVN